MSKKLISFCLLMALCVNLLGCKSKKGSDTTPSPTEAVQEQTSPDTTDNSLVDQAVTLEVNNYFDDQKQIDEGLMAEAGKKY